MKKNNSSTEILITVQTFYPIEDGVSRVTRYLAEGLVEDGYKVTVITGNPTNDFPKEELYKNILIKRVNLRTKYGLYFGDKKKYKELIDIESAKADVMINVCTQNAFTDVILKNLGKYDCKKILYMHGMFDFRFHTINFTSFRSIVNKLWKELRWFIYYSLNGLSFKKYDSIVQLHTKDYGTEFFKRKYGLSSCIVGNAVDDEFFSHADCKGFKKPFDKYIIYVARYEDGKNQKLAISEYLKAAIDSSMGLVLIGPEKNKYYVKLKKYIDKCRKHLGLSEKEKPIILLHHIDREYISSYVANAYLYLMTSRTEVFPMSIVESIACGVPFISTDVGVVRFLMGGSVAKKKDLRYWIECYCNDSSIRDRQGDLCRDFASKEFKVRNQIEAIEKEINRIIGKKDV